MIELSYDIFCGKTTFQGIDNASRTLNVVSKLTDSKSENDKFGIFKVNGSAVYSENGGFWKYTFGANLNFEFDKKYGKQETLATFFFFFCIKLNYKNVGFQIYYQYAPYPLFMKYHSSNYGSQSLLVALVYRQ